MRQYHKSHPWRLGPGGVMAPHIYPFPKELSWWDDVGFVLNGKRIMVWWTHPRAQYADAIDDAAHAEADKAGSATDLFFSGEKGQATYKRLGRSRKKVLHYTMGHMSDMEEAYLSRYNTAYQRLSDEGIDQVIRPGLRIQRLSWCFGMDLCLPLHVNSKEEAIALAATAKRVFKDKLSLASLAIPADYSYSRIDWLAEKEARVRDQAAFSGHYAATD